MVVIFNWKASREKPTWEASAQMRENIKVDLEETAGGHELDSAGTE
jgi:hypothetical protein